MTTIKDVKSNNRKRCFEIETTKGDFSFPFAKLKVIPSASNKVTEVYVDRRFAKEAITYVLQSGEEGSVHVADFLFYNRDPDYMRDMAVHKLTVKAMRLLEESGLSKREVARRLKTSPARLYQLLDPTFYKKTIDQMMKLLAALDYKLEFVVEKDKRSAA